MSKTCRPRASPRPGVMHLPRTSISTTCLAPINGTADTMSVGQVLCTVRFWFYLMMSFTA